MTVMSCAFLIFPLMNLEMMSDTQYLSWMPTSVLAPIGHGHDLGKHDLPLDVFILLLIDCCRQAKPSAQTQCRGRTPCKPGEESSRQRPRTHRNSQRQSSEPHQGQGCSVQWVCMMRGGRLIGTAGVNSRIDVCRHTMAARSTCSEQDRIL